MTPISMMIENGWFAITGRDYIYDETYLILEFQITTTILVPRIVESQ